MTAKVVNHIIWHYKIVFCDDKFIAAALAANAEIIVSGDSDLLELIDIAGVRVLKPTDFSQKYVEQGVAYYPKQQSAFQE